MRELSSETVRGDVFCWKQTFVIFQCHFVSEKSHKFSCGICDKTFQTFPLIICRDILPQKLGLFSALKMFLCNIKCIFLPFITADFTAKIYQQNLVHFLLLFPVLNSTNYSRVSSDVFYDRISERKHEFFSNFFLKCVQAYPTIPLRTDLNINPSTPGHRTALYCTRQYITHIIATHQPNIAKTYPIASYDDGRKGRTMAEGQFQL